MSDEEELATDLRLYGSCYWKYIDGKKVRVPIEKVQYINGEAMEVDGETVCAHSEHGCEHCGSLEVNPKCPACHGIER